MNKISNKSYYTEFFSDKISKKKKLIIIRSSNEKQIKYIRDLRKNKKVIRNSLCFKEVYRGFGYNNYLSCLKKLSCIFVN